MTEEEWLAATHLATLLKWLQRSKRQRTSERKLRLFGCACCRRMWHLLSEHSQGAVIIAEGFAEGKVTEDQVYEIRGSLDASGHGAVSWVLWLPSMTYWKTSRIETAMRSVAGYSASALSDPNEETEEAVQCEILRDVVANPFRPSSIDESWIIWRDGTVRRLARRIYDERQFKDMPVLADALEEAGCTNIDILSHCRRPGPHVRGCWVLDLVLGKE